MSKGKNAAMANKHGSASAKPLMLQGTSSHVGKSVITAAMCRILRDMNIKVAPFKAQNMALNAAVTQDGSEIAFAQAFQAAAAGIAPTADMNPVLLKPTGDSRCQVIIQGKSIGDMSAKDYHSYKKEARRFVLESYTRLASTYDVIIIEGAGSPAEVNLRENDIANMGIAEMTNSPVAIVGDIDRGGVFASLVGTMELLTKEEKKRVAGFIINKFRGDIALLRPGLAFLEERCGLPVLGVVPYLKDVTLPSEDSVSLDEESGARSRGLGFSPEPSTGKIRIVVVRLPRISNFTDFDPFRSDRGVELVFTEDPAALSDADMIILPGTKNTVEDLIWLRDRGFFPSLKAHAKSGRMIAGICGGYQMLGRTVKDPVGVESNIGSAEGLSLLNAETVLKNEKSTHRVDALVAFMRETVHNIVGYEIHAGVTEGEMTHFASITSRDGKEVKYRDGGVSEDKNVWGTYIHGIFDNDNFRDELLSVLKKKKGIEHTPGSSGFADTREKAIASFASFVRSSVEMDKIMKIIGI